MQPENRRSFVKKSVATTISLSSATFFSSLIRARGDEGGGEETTSDPWGTTYATTDSATTETWATTASTEESTSTDETTDLPTKPKRRLYSITLWYKGYDPATGDPIYSSNPSDAVPFSGQAVPPQPQVTGAPAADGGAGTLKAGGIAFGAGQGSDIQTTEAHTSINLNNDINPNPKATPTRVPAAGGGDLIKFIVQTSYTWVYPSSP